MRVVDEQMVAHPDTEQRAPRVVGLQRGKAVAHFGDRMHPEVEDAGGGDEGRGGVEQVAQGAEHVTPDIGDPSRGVAELLEIGRGLALLAVVAVTELPAPDADPSEVHVPILVEVA